MEYLHLLRGVGVVRGYPLIDVFDCLPLSQPKLLSKALWTQGLTVKIPCYLYIHSFFLIVPLVFDSSQLYG